MLQQRDGLLFFRLEDNGALGEVGGFAGGEGEFGFGGVGKGGLEVFGDSEGVEAAWRTSDFLRGVDKCVSDVCENAM